MNNDRIYYSHDAEIHAVRKMTRLMVLCLIVGLGIGAALAFLFAPPSAKKVRDDLTKAVGQGWSRGREAIEPMVRRAEKEFGELQKNVEEHLKQS
jgi:gas vesicle protein